MQPTDSLAPADRGRPAGVPVVGHSHSGIGCAHGKAILLGEHAVVYGAPALVVPIPQLTATATATVTRTADAGGGGTDRIAFAMVGLGSTVVTTLVTESLRHLVTEFKALAAVAEPLGVDIVIDSAVPQGRGLGSSAAFARAAVLALANAFGRRLDAREVFDLVQSSETVTHGRASGIDAAATGATSALVFQAGNARRLPIVMSGNDADHSGGTDDRGDAAGILVIADSGVGGSTNDAVELLGRKFERNADLRETFVHRVSDLTTAALDDLAHGELSSFGARLTQNHWLLHELGISTERIDVLVETALAAGGLGAKITGGGLGGCLVALAEDPGRADAIRRRLHEAGAVRTWVVPTRRVAGYAD